MVERALWIKDAQWRLCGRLTLVRGRHQLDLPLAAQPCGLCTDRLWCRFRLLLTCGRRENCNSLLTASASFHKFLVRFLNLPALCCTRDASLTLFGAFCSDVIQVLRVKQ